MKSVIFPFIVFCIFSFLLTTGYTKEYTILTEPLAPVHFQENGEIKGIATEIVQAVFDEAQIDNKIQIFPWKRAYSMVLREPDTFIYTINRTEKREPLFHWIGPILSKETSLYKLKSRTDIKLDSLEDAKKYITVAILGHSLTTALLDAGFKEGQNMVTLEDKASQIKVFVKGRVDLITGNQYTIYRALKAQGYSINDVEPALLISTRGYYLGANKETELSVVERLREANYKVQQSGIVQKLIQKYMH